MPLKHHTETAYMLLLALVIGVSGFVASLLPHLPGGIGAWAVCFTLAFIYPLLFTATFRDNRADYEFRALHWFPALIFLSWIVLELLGPLFSPLHILQLGLFFLWSLPLVALGIAFLIIFALHVLRRSTSRIGILSVFLALFIAGSVAAEAANINPKASLALFSPTSGLPAFTKRTVIAIGGYVSSLYHPPVGPVTVAGVGSSSSLKASPASVSSASSKSSQVAVMASSSSKPVISMVKPPKNLPQSGPETAALLFLTLMSLYCFTLHVRARQRI